MPAQALISLMATQISMPMQFEIQNQSTGRVSHCRVFEFTGEEGGAVFLPDWMMKNMQLQEGDRRYMKNKTLEKGTYIKIQPHTIDFLGISNPKAVLEENLPNCDVDFDPLDYKEPEKCVPKSASGKEQEEATQKPKFKPFTGLARRLDEKPCSTELESASLPNEQPSTQKSEAAEAKPMSKRSPQGFAFQSDRNQHQNKGKELAGKTKAETLKNKPKFQPFTGKKYTLAG
ncbi:hypothetical protein CRYUN_Cryun16bG0087700 [Craigia yunnanensis]